MNKFKVFIVTIFLAGFFSNQKITAQQIKRFSQDSVRFMTEVEYFFKQIDSKDKRKQAEEFIEKFKLDWNGGKYSDKQRKKVYAHANAMLKKRLRAIPHFIEYLSAIMEFINSEKNENDFLEWHKSVDYMLKNEKLRNYLAYLENSKKLLKGNIIYESSTTVWKTNNSNYVFKFIEKPLVIFPELNLKCYAKRDSIEILETSGAYDPIEESWKGKGGKVTWERAGYKANEVYAVFKEYEIEMKYSHYEIDTVTFYNTKYFKEPLLGSFKDKTMAISSPENSSYPRFNSFNKRISIEDIFTDIDYLGGFSFRGAKLYGTGTDEEKAICTFFKDDKPFIITKANTYIIRNDRISSDVVSTTVFYQNDSIFHPYIEMRYLDQSKELAFNRVDQGLYESPFFNSYHKLDMYFESLTWRIGSSTINFEMTKGFTKDAKADFSSSSRFNPYEFERLQGMDTRNPMYIIREHAKEKGSDTITVSSLAKHMTVEDYQVIGLLVALSGQGMIDYNENTKTAVLKDKFYFTLKAKGGITDYDVINFSSNTHDMSNGVLDLDSFDLKLNGVQMIELSNAQGVYIYPYDEEITVKENRDFAFEGRIHSGLFDFYGKEFYFDYDNFKINLNNTDSMKFKMPTDQIDDYGRSQLTEVRTALEDVNGELFIDAPGNKSGKMKFPQFPIFKCDPKTNSFVYYDKPFIQGGVYDRNRFYFQVKPFTIDSLDNTSTSGLSFNGTFVSGGIFPEMEDSLMVQPDMSLGLVRMTGDASYPAYGGKGKYFNKIQLSYEGLKGDGTLEYLTSTSESDEFMFFLDSCNATLKSHVVEEQVATVEYPPVTAEDVYMHWMPYEDLMSVSKIQKPLDFYAGKSKLHGRMDYGPSSMHGNGIITFYNSRLHSRDFFFKQHEFMADTADFELNATDSDELALTTTNYNSHIDFKEELGKFVSNGGVAQISFPINQYVSYMDEFDWFMDKGDIEMRNTTFTDIDRLEKLSLSELIDEDLSSSNFLSVHPQQDSLRFFSSKGHYNIGQNVIEAENVKIIKVADAAVYPDSGRVDILKRAEMKTLMQAQVLADTANRLHRFYNATINITSRKKYYGRGKFDYIDENDEAQEIYFDNINVDDSLYKTYAIGTISDISDFALSPYFDYQGTVTLNAPKKYLNFDGGVKLMHDCANLERYWYYFNADINPDTIQIPVPEQPREYNKDRNKIYAGIYIAKDTTDIHTAFLTRKHSFSDTAIINSKGYLVYHHPTDEYRISSLKKLNNRDSLPGSYLSLSTFDCETYGEGKMNLGMDFGQIEMESYGNIRHYTNADTAIMNMLLTFDFYFEDKAIKSMREDFESYTDLKGIDYYKFSYRKTLAEVVGKTKADEILSKLELFGSYRRVPEKLEHNIVLADVKFKWDEDKQSYVSTDKIGVNNINKNPINKYFDGYVELKRRKHGGHELSIYLEASKDDWYFFNYRNNFMQGISSNEEFNNLIKETKEDDRKLKVEKGEAPYSFYLSTERKKKDFIKKMKE